MGTVSSCHTFPHINNHVRAPGPSFWFQGGNGGKQGRQGEPRPPMVAWLGCRCRSHRRGPEATWEHRAGDPDWFQVEVSRPRFAAPTWLPALAWTEPRTARSLQEVSEGPCRAGRSAARPKCRATGRAARLSKDRVPVHSEHGKSLFGVSMSQVPVVI